jgi:OOP family OmpA-OmpF porin
MMKALKLVAAAVLVPIFLSGCSSIAGDRPTNYCVLGGAIAGAAAGIGLDGGIIGGLVGAGAGAVMGEAHCLPEEMAKGPMDSDGDGVNDDRDKCPGTPKGLSVDALGCHLDDDGDGVPNHKDACPGTPKGTAVNAIGCPLDSDGDGVPDASDKCPDTKPGMKVDADGCDVRVEIVTNINFDFDKADIRADAKPKLDTVVALLKANPDVSVLVVGHTDSTGAEEYNMKLSQARAASVRDYLVGNGIGTTRLSVKGAGEGVPLVSNKSRAGRAVNRRVEFEVR